MKSVFPQEQQILLPNEVSISARRTADVVTK
jgi:hypothetical protein